MLVGFLTIRPEVKGRLQERAADILALPHGVLNERCEPGSKQEEEVRGLVLGLVQSLADGDVTVSIVPSDAFTTLQAGHCRDHVIVDRRFKADGEGIADPFSWTGREARPSLRS